VAILPRKASLKAAEFERLVAENERLVLGTAYRILGRLDEAQDVSQEVFLRLFRNLERVDSEPRAWLYRVTVNICNDHFRRRKPTVQPDETRADPGPSPERALAEDERKRLLMEGLQVLGERERASVVLRDIEGLSTREVAGILGVEEATVRSHIWAARVKLAKYVRDRNELPGM